VRLLGPQGFAKSRTLRWLHRNGAPAWGATPAGIDRDRVERVVRSLQRVFGPEGYFPVRTSGLDALPASPSLLVSTHSGGSTMLDCLGLGFAWYLHFGTCRPLHFLAHEILLSTRLSGPLFDGLGVLRADRRIARQALGQWRRDLIVFPGGDRDTWRPYRDRYRVRFSGHTGYARLALATGVPIVPVVNAGPHNTLIVLADGRRIADRLHLHELLRIDVFPIHLSFPWGLGVGPWPHLPIPRHFHYRFGPPIHAPEDHVPGRPPTEETVRELDRRVRATMQSMLDDLAHRHDTSRGWLDRKLVDVGASSSHPLDS
jgi:1-acyl-sn-glycerol-3-phosphate acyltransferase